MNTYDQMRAEIAALSGDALREYVADMMGQSICAGEVPRHVILGRLAKMTDMELRVHLGAALEHARLMEAAGANAIGYEVGELERVRERQRNLKE